MAHKHKFRRRNPHKDLRAAAGLLPGALVGAVASRAVPQMFFSGVNTGSMGYLANAGVTALLYAVLPGEFGSGALLGGLVALGMRITNDLMPGMGLGAYWPSMFAVPTVSNAIGQTISSPYPARVA